MVREGMDFSWFLQAWQRSSLISLLRPMGRSSSTKQRVHEEEEEIAGRKDLTICMLPHDLLIDILCKIPMKSVFRCKYVSKEWKTLISDPYFISCYQKPAISGYYFYQECGIGSTVIRSLSLDDEEIGSVPDTSSISFLQHRYCIWGSCNGLLLSESPQEHKFYVSNPLTKKWVPIPIGRLNHKMVGVGLAFDPCKSPHFNVVMLIEINSGTKHEVIATTYCSERSWWGSDYPVLPLLGEQPIFGNQQHTLLWPVELPRQVAVFSNGALHWIARDNRHDIALVYNLNSTREEELVRMLRLPGSFRYVVEMEMGGGVSSWVVSRACLGESEGRLHYVSYHEFNRLHVWVPREYHPSTYSDVKWDLIHNIVIAPVPMAPFVPFGFHPANKALLVCQRGKIVCYHLQTLACKVVCELPQEHRDSVAHYALFFPYCHSLMGPFP